MGKDNKICDSILNQAMIKQVMLVQDEVVQDVIYRINFVQYIETYKSGNNKHLKQYFK